MITSNVLKSAAFTFIQAFLGIFLVAVTSWLQEILDWVSKGDTDTVFPNPDVLGEAAVSAVIAGIIAVITGVHTVLRNRGVLGEAPKYPSVP